MPLLTTAEHVSSILALSLNDSDVAQAQSVLEIVLGVDLSSPAPETRFSASDLKRLRDAIVWQVAYLEAHPEVLTAQDNISSVSSNGSSISFDTAVSEGYLAPLAERVLRGLSWLSGPRRMSTIKPAPRTDYEVAPDPWVRIFG